MKKLILGIAILLIGIALSVVPLVAAPPAHADQNSYVAALAQEGIYAPAGPYALINLGYMVCTDAYQGYTVGYSVHNVYYYHDADGTLTWDSAKKIVAAALIYLC